MIVAVCFFIGVTETGAFQNILSIFMKPMSSEFGWSRSSITGAMAFGSICGGIVSPFVGPVLDRYGPRLVTFTGIFCLSVGLIGMTFLGHLWQLYLLFGVGRMFAVGVLNLAVAVTVSNWFVSRRGTAMGLAWLGPQIGSALLPVLTQFFIIAQGWRMACSTLGGIVFLISGIPALIFLRRRPEDMGLLPDGADGDLESRLTKEDERSAAGPATDDREWTRAEAIHQPAFWTLTFLNSMILFLHAGISFHIFPFLTDQGIDKLNAVLILSTIAISSAIGSVAWGILADKFHIQKLLSMNLYVSGFIFLMLFYIVTLKAPNAIDIKAIFGVAAVHGILFGGRFSMLDIIWAKFFGRKSLGSVYGLASPFRFSANAIGPLFAAYCFDFLGNYSFPFYVFTLIFLITATISYFLKAPKTIFTHDIQDVTLL